MSLHVSPAEPLGGIDIVRLVYSISNVILWDISNNKAHLNSTSGMPLLGQPSFCLKVTSSLVLFLFQTQDDLTVKRCLLPAVFSCGLYTAVFLSLILSCLFSLVIPRLLIDVTYLVATRATLYCSPFAWFVESYNPCPTQPGQEPASS